MTIRRMRIACRLTKATETHTEYVILTCFSTVNSGYANAHQCYVTHIKWVLFLSTTNVTSNRFTFVAFSNYLFFVISA